MKMMVQQIHVPVEFLFLSAMCIKTA